MKLNIEHEVLEHPYANLPRSNGEVWSKIILKVMDEKGRLVRTVLDWQWDIVAFLNWLVGYEGALRSEIAPYKLDAASIAKGVYNYYRKLDEPIDMEEVEQIYEYRERHGLHFALKGTDVDEIYLGVNKGRFTISLCKGKKSWNYEVDAEDFFKKIHSIYNEIHPISHQNELDE